MSPNVDVDGREIVCTGQWLRVARIFDEAWIERAPLIDAGPVVAALRQSDMRADLFTFGATQPGVPPLPYPREWERLAVVSTRDFQEWWTNLPHASQGNVRKAARSSVHVRTTGLDESFVRGVKAIYDETPVRQGKRFRHYGCDLKTIRDGLVSYPDRSIFLGAILGGELIGFLKMVVVGTASRIMHCVSLQRHHDKRPNNALIAEAVRICAARSLHYLIYDRYDYNRAPSPLNEFKRRNGFQAVSVPRYYIPITFLGRIALATGAHRGASALMPACAIVAWQSARSAYTRTVAAFNRASRWPWAREKSLQPNR